MDSNVTQLLLKRRVEMAYFPVVVFGYLATINQTRNYLILVLVATITSPIAFHWIARGFGGIDPTNTDRNPQVSLVQEIPFSSPVRVVCLFVIIIPYMILFIFGIPIFLYLNFTFDDTVVVAMTLFYTIFIISSQGDRFFVDDDSNQSTLSDFR